MVQTAKAVLVNGEWMAEIERPDACAHCGACAHGQQQVRHYPLPRGNYREGEPVEIALPDTGALPAAVIAYGVPGACMLLGLGAGALMRLPELAQAALALIALAGGYFLLKALEPRIRKSGRFQVKYHCPDQQNKGGHHHGD